jgi:hypothetical protein
VVLRGRAKRSRKTKRREKGGKARREMKRIKTVRQRNLERSGGKADPFLLCWPGLGWAGAVLVLASLSLILAWALAPVPCSCTPYLRRRRIRGNVARWRLGCMKEHRECPNRRAGEETDSQVAPSPSSESTCDGNDERLRTGATGSMSCGAAFARSQKQPPTEEVNWAKKNRGFSAAPDSRRACRAGQQGDFWRDRQLVKCAGPRLAK